MSAATHDPKKTLPSASPFILEKARDLGRPRGGISTPTDVAHLPGEAGFVAGVRNMWGWARRGTAHLLEQRRRFGPVYRTMFLNQQVICVVDPTLAMEIARNEDGVWSSALAWRQFFEGIDPAVPTIDIPVTLDFEPHRDARKLLQPAFSAAATASYVDTATPMFARAIERWTDRGHVAFKHEVRRLLAHVSSRIIAGIEEPADVALFERALAAYWAAPYALTKNRLLSFKWRRAVAGHRRLREFLHPRVAERRARGGDDLFSRLCAETGRPDWVDDDTIVRLFIGVLGGAFDTTAAGTASMAYLLAKHPEWQERLRVEASSVGPCCSASDLKNLEATERVWKETLRLFSVTGVLPRRALREVGLGAWRIPAGTFVVVLVGALAQTHRAGRSRRASIPTGFRTHAPRTRRTKEREGSACRSDGAKGAESRRS
jgi:cytochrome P450